MPARRRKNFLPTILLALLNWGVVAFFVLAVDPEIIRDFPIAGSYFLFFVFLFMATFLTVSLILVHARRGLLTAIGLVVFLYLRLLGLGHLLNALLLFSFLLIFEIALSRN